MLRALVSSTIFLVEGLILMLIEWLFFVVSPSAADHVSLLFLPLGRVFRVLVVILVQSALRAILVELIASLVSNIFN